MKMPAMKYRRRLISTENLIKEGVLAQEALLRSASIEGTSQIGWKLGFSSAAAKTRFGTSRALVGFLLDKKQIPNNCTLDISKWVKPVLEPEIAIYFDKDVNSAEDLFDSVSAVGPAYELADLFAIHENPLDVTSSNIYQRHFILGSKNSNLRDLNLSHLSATVDSQDIPDVEGFVGSMKDLLSDFAIDLQNYSRKIKAGDFVITGSIIPPIFIETGKGYSYTLDGFEELTINIS
mgnify:CR=1 FL=1